MLRITRTLTLTVALAALVLLGWWQIRDRDREAALRELADLNDAMRARLMAREAMIERLGRTQRLAHIEILDQTVVGDGTVDETRLRFIELDDGGSEIARQDFTIPGDVLFVDAWTVKFAHDDVATGHPLFGRALVLFRRIYSDRMPPAEGFAIDTPGATPPGYASSDVGFYEQRLWSHFWELATDPDLAEKMGVRVAQGEAVYKPVATGQEFSLRVDSVGGMSLTPIRTAGVTEPSGS